jgi:ABC-2 type transport system ATP-binding protein
MSKLIKVLMILGNHDQITRTNDNKWLDFYNDNYINELKNIDGVYEVEENSEEYVVKIENEDVIDKVFKYIKKCKNVTKFNVEDATLNEIFLNKVGGAYEK